MGVEVGRPDRQRVVIYRQQPRLLLDPVEFLVGEVPVRVIEQVVAAFDPRRANPLAAGVCVAVEPYAPRVTRRVLPETPVVVIHSPSQSSGVPTAPSPEVEASGIEVVASSMLTDSVEEIVGHGVVGPPS